MINYMQQSRFKFYLIILRIAVKNIVNIFLANFLQFKPWNTNKRDNCALAKVPVFLFVESFMKGRFK